MLNITFSLSSLLAIWRTCELEKAMATYSSTLAWKIPWMEEPGRLQSMGSLRVGHNWATSLSLFTFMHWRRKWQPTPVFLPEECQGRGSLAGCHLWGRRVGHDWSDLAVAAASCFQFGDVIRSSVIEKLPVSITLLLREVSFFLAALKTFLFVFGCL